MGARKANYLRHASPGPRSTGPYPISPTPAPPTAHPSHPRETTLRPTATDPPQIGVCRGRRAG